MTYGNGESDDGVREFASSPLGNGEGDFSYPENTPLEASPQPPSWTKSPKTTRDILPSFFSDMEGAVSDQDRKEVLYEYGDKLYRGGSFGAAEAVNYLTKEWTRYKGSQEEFEKRDIRLTKLKEDEAEARHRKFLRDRGEDPWGRTERGVKRLTGIAKAGYMASTLGGKLPPPVKKVANKNLYSSEGMRDLIIPKSSGAETKQDLYFTKPMARQPMNLDKLRQAGSLNQTSRLTQMASPRRSLGAMGSRIPSGPIGLAGTSPSLFRLRDMIVPKGRTPIEQVVLKQLQTTPEPDTMDTVVQTLVSMGLPRAQAEQAINSLLERGVVKRVQGGLEVA